ncbi:MAG: hypothetical protein O9350_10870 [Microcystis sp. LE19-388.1G]|nr:hypothetical protein [Microcystis sp. LE19-388.1G]
MINRFQGLGHGEISITRIRGDLVSCLQSSLQDCPSILTKANIPQLGPPERHRTLTHSFNQCAWCVPQKSIGGAVGATLGNAPYSDCVLLRSAFGIALSSQR